MPPAQLPVHEAERLCSLQACGILDTPPDPRFDAFTTLAARLLDAPIALVSLLDATRQWFKSAVGLPSGSGTSRDIAFCAHAVLQPDRPLVVEDATLDPRFADNPLVTGPMGLRFYAGVPLVDGAGLALGTLCIADTSPRRLTAAELETLVLLAAGVRSLLELTRTSAALEQSAERLSAVLESTTDSVVVLDEHWRFTYVNQRAVDLLSCERPILGSDLWETCRELVGTKFEQCCREAMLTQSPREYEATLPGTSMTLQVNLFPSREALTIFFRDVSERRRIQDERRVWQDRIAYLARHDPLTGLGNRLLFDERLDETLAALPNCTVLWIDLDHFKAVNDTLGHAVGDATLRRAADRLSACVRESDVVARLGGDEFVVLQPDVGNAADAADVARRIVAAFAEPFPVDGHLVTLGASIGIAVSPADGAQAALLLRSADTALYRAKADGRGCFRFFETDMQSPLLAQQRLKAGLGTALERCEFELDYQPILDLRTGALSRFEALLRWRHPTLGRMLPNAFLELAEEVGAILPIGRWVLQQACRDAAAWPAVVGVSVNLSPAQFATDEIVATVAEALAQSGLPASRLELEITELVRLADGAAELGRLRALHDLGLRIALDDFGTGYSSLRYLRSFPFDTLKIDRSFVSDLPGGEDPARSCAPSPAWGAAWASR